jgi:hypothetical protein
MEGVDSRLGWALLWLAASAIGALGCSHQPAPAAAPAPPPVGSAPESSRVEPAPAWDRPEIPVPQGSSRLPDSMLCEPSLPPRAEAADAGAPKGWLDKEPIRRIIRRHMNAVRFCYQAGMGSPPYAQGRVATRFAINRDGKVRRSCLVSSTLGQPGGELCIINELLRWEFPKPEGGGWVVVDYPFVFTPVPDPAE